MGEKTVVPFTEVVQPLVSLFVLDEPVLGALPVAGEEHVTLQALLGQGIVFIIAELLLLRRVHHGGERLGVDIAEAILGKNEVVTGVDIAVELHHAGVTAPSGQCADPRLFADPVGQSGVE